MSRIVSELAARSRMTVADVRLIIRTAPSRYKVYPIPKRNGEDRIIAHPARELKALQRALVLQFGQTLPVHPSVTAYEPGCSIKLNAEQHAQNRWLAKFDIEDFFNSITSAAWIDFLSDQDIDQELIDISAQLFFWLPRRANQPCLSVGAPSSPFVSNRFMLPFDEALSKFCVELGYAYTRYADDVAISHTNEMDRDRLISAVEEALAGPGIFQLNQQKTRFLGPGQRRSVTGLILANEGRATVGRTRRRAIEAMVHRLVVKLEDVNVDKVRGNLAFLKFVDPPAYERLQNKFGEHANEAGFQIF